jgi:streptogramin lyase
LSTKGFFTFAVLFLAAAACVYGALGDVVGSFAIPGGACAGLGRSNGYLYTTNYSQSMIYRVNPSSGSITNSFSAAGGSDTRGLAYQFGGYLWQNKAYTSPYTIYRTNEGTGSVYDSYSLPTSVTHGSAPLATGDGGEGTSYIILSSYGTPGTIYYMTTTGSIARSHTVSQALYEIAYDWRNGLIWGGMNTTTVYGFTTTGSLAASFTKPTGNIYGITYHGQYLWVAGTSGLIYIQHCPILNVNVKPSSMGKIKAMFE